MRMDRRTLLQLLPASFLNFGAAKIIPFSRERKRARDLGIRIGTMEAGKWNAITDVAGVKVGHSTIIRGSGPLKVGEGPVRTGVTAIWPHDHIHDEYLPFGFHILNGNGEVTGLAQSASLGIIGSPIFTTSTDCAGIVYDAALSQMPKDEYPPLLPVVGETWDGYLNDIEGRHVHAEHVWEAMKNAASGPVPEGCVGGGTGMRCWWFKGGIGTASRVVPGPQKFTVGAIVQTNYNDPRELLRIDGVPVGEKIMDLRPEPEEASYFNSIVIIIATDAPLLDYQLDRLARRGALGLAKTGSCSHNSSGDFILAFSTANRIPKADFWNGKTYSLRCVEDYDIDPLFQAASEATEEAIINALFMATDMTGIDGHKLYALPIDRTLRIMEQYHRLFRKKEKKVATL